LTLRNQNADGICGASIELNYTLYTADDELYVVPENVVFSWTLSQTAHDEAIISKTSEDGSILVDVEASIASVSLTQGQTIGLKPGRYYCRLATIDLNTRDVFVEAEGCLALRRAPVPLVSTSTLKASLGLSVTLVVDAVVV
jgi:hypothetical protein